MSVFILNKEVFCLHFGPLAPRKVPNFDSWGANWG